MKDEQYESPVFPKWVNTLPAFIFLGSTLAFLTLIFIFWYWLGPKSLEVGYAPEQPIKYSHKLHAGDLGIDCRYCHFNVETSSHATIPTTETCMNCHAVVKSGPKTGSSEIAKIHASFTENKPIEWVKVHQLPDYVYFDHSRHVNSGVSCVTCHGRVDQMEVVHQVEPLSMGWCLDCHRAPDANLRPKELVTKMDWKAENALETGRIIREAYHIRPGEDCSTCHR